jgi:hypothetical protein
MENLRGGRATAIQKRANKAPTSKVSPTLVTTFWRLASATPVGEYAAPWNAVASELFAELSAALAEKPDARESADYEETIRAFSQTSPELYRVLIRIRSLEATAGGGDGKTGPGKSLVYEDIDL